MIKFTAAGEGCTLVGLGLEPENIRRMQNGEPIRVRFSDLGFTGALGSVQIMIFTGKDAAAMRRAIDPLIGPETVIHGERPDPEPRYGVIPEFNMHGGAGWVVFDRSRQAPEGGWFADRIAAERTAAVLNGEPVTFPPARE